MVSVVPVLAVALAGAIPAAADSPRRARTETLTTAGRQFQARTPYSATDNVFPPAELRDRTGLLQPVRLGSRGSEALVLQVIFNHSACSVRDRVHPIAQPLLVSADYRPDY